MTRQITSCLTCRRRKVRCDRRTPICSICQKGNYTCAYKSQSLRENRANRSSDSQTATWDQGFVSTAHQEHPNMENGSSCVRDNDSERKGGRPTQLNETVFLQDEYSRLIASTNGTSSMTEPFKAADCSSSDAHPSASASASSVVGDAGQNMATNVSVDIARQSKNDQHRGAEAISPLPYNTSFSSSQACISTLMGARLNANKNLTSYYPQSERLCRRLSDTFFSNVEPVLCLFHKPTLRRAFNAHLAQQELYSSVLPRLSPSKPSRTDPFEPLLFSIFFSAIHSMDAIQVHDMFGVNKTDMLTRFEEAFMSALDNESFLSRPSIAVLQAFVLYLVSSYKIRFFFGT